MHHFADLLLQTDDYTRLFIFRCCCYYFKWDRGLKCLLLFSVGAAISLTCLLDAMQCDAMNSIPDPYRYLPTYLSTRLAFVLFCFSRQSFFFKLGNTKTM